MIVAAVSGVAGGSESATITMTDNASAAMDSSTGPSVTSTTTTTLAPTTTLPPRADPALLGATHSGPLDGYLIVVDPGHNGRNFQYTGTTREDSPHLCNTTGATSTSGTSEAEINWSIGTELASMLNGVGAAVLLTHEDNDGFGPCADERGALAHDHGAAAFVSLHADGSSSGGSGFHIIHPAVHEALTPETVQQSSVLASVIRDELSGVGGRPANYVGRSGVQERGDLANLNTANRPSVLAELGNLRNPIDSVMLEEPPSQRVIAAALARGLLRFFGKPTDSTFVRGDVTQDGLPDPLPDYSTTTTTTTTTTSTTSTTTIVPSTMSPVSTTTPTTGPPPPGG